MSSLHKNWFLLFTKAIRRDFSEILLCDFSLLVHWWQMSLNVWILYSGLTSLHYKISKIQKPFYEVTFESSKTSWSDSDFLLCCGNLMLSVTWGLTFMCREDCLWAMVSFSHKGLIFFSKYDLFFCFSSEIYIYHIRQTQKKYTI